MAGQELDKVQVLPGQEFDISFSRYSGYVNEESGRAFFYWFIEAEEDPDSSCFGSMEGPGCSSISYGEAEEIDHLHIQADRVDTFPESTFLE